jgi:organic hydroperoxide reductase OsmC/OhrA
MSDESTTAFTLTLKDNYAFTVDFGENGPPPIMVDEMPPLGHGEGPSPTRLLGAALAGCLGASLLFCLRKARVDVPAMRTEVRVSSGRNAKGRLRVTNVDVRLVPSVPADQIARMTRCLEVFEDFCTVTAAVRDGVQVNVSVDTQPA